MNIIKDLQSKVIEQYLCFEGKYIEHKNVDAFLKKIEKYPKLHAKLLAAVYARRIIHWGRYKDTLLRGVTLTGIQRKNVEVILNNTLYYLVQPYTNTKYPYREKLPVKLVLKTALRVANSLAATVGKLASLQSMTAPACLGMRLCVVDGDVSVPVRNSLLGDSTMVPVNKLVLKTTMLTAKSRKLQAGWTIEAMQDMKAFHGLDIEEEIAKAIASETVHEIIAEIIQKIKDESQTVDLDFNQSSFFEMSMDGFNPDFSARMRQIGDAIRKASLAIAEDTSRGMANIVIASPVTVALMQADRTLDFKLPNEGEADKEEFNLRYAGTLNNTVKVYMSMCFGANDDGFIIGYRGTEVDSDSGLIYAPYIPLMPTGPVVNPTTFQPIMGVHSRYDLQMCDGNYYRYLKFSE